MNYPVNFVEKRLQQGPCSEEQAEEAQESSGHADQPEISAAEEKIQAEEAPETAENEKPVRDLGMPPPEGPQGLVDQLQQKPQQAAVEKLPGGKLRRHYRSSRESQLPPSPGSS